ncbi:MAG: hypothetical protein KDC79_13400 [Cyclobacteriaceae bacterium]|nr:hypothetical protein [Cyclobacteriaceae bacterium]
MKNLIKVGKNSFLLIAFTTLFMGCAGIKKLNNDYESIILFSSKFENENCNLKLNDSLIFQDQKIKTERSWGIDPNKPITLQKINSQLKVEVNCTAKFEIMEINVATRNVALDTLLDLERGKYILIEIGGSSIGIGQSKKKIVID